MRGGSIIQFVVLRGSRAPFQAHEGGEVEIHAGDLVEQHEQRILQVFPKPSSEAIKLL